MSNFLDELDVTPLPDGVLWRLNKNFRYQSGTYGALITVPAGFVTDFASTPREVWMVYPPWGKYGPAAILHDWFYRIQFATREMADDVLREAMILLGCDELTVHNIYGAVRLFGRWAWSENARRMRDETWVGGIGV